MEKAIIPGSATREEHFQSHTLDCITRAQLIQGILAPLFPAGLQAG